MSDIDNTTTRSDVNKGARSRSVLWLGIGFGTVIAGGLLYALLHVSYGGKNLRQFCGEILSGIPSEEIIATARDAGFEVRELRDIVLITLAGKRVGHTCFVTIDQGKVTEAHSAYTH